MKTFILCLLAFTSIFAHEDEERIHGINHSTYPGFFNYQKRFPQYTARLGGGYYGQGSRLLHSNYSPLVNGDYYHGVGRYGGLYGGLGGLGGGYGGLGLGLGVGGLYGGLGGGYGGLGGLGYGGLGGLGYGVGAGLGGYF